MVDVLKTPVHTLTVHFDEGECEYLTLECHLSGADRPCAVIDCPVDHEDVSQACIEAHGATARDACWAVEWYEAGGRETLNTEALSPVVVPVHLYFDDGIAVEDAGQSKVDSERSD